MSLSTTPAQKPNNRKKIRVNQVNVLFQEAFLVLKRLLLDIVST